MSETSQVSFLVRGNAGQPLADQTVNFQLNTEIGGVSLVAAKGTTNAEGKVTTSVRAGSIPTSIRVTATVEGKSAAGDTIRIFTQSDTLTLSTGIQIKTVTVFIPIAMASRSPTFIPITVSTNHLPMVVQPIIATTPAKFLSITTTTVSTTAPWPTFALGNNDRDNDNAGNCRRCFEIRRLQHEC